MEFEAAADKALRDDVNDTCRGDGDPVTEAVADKSNDWEPAVADLVDVDVPLCVLEAIEKVCGCDKDTDLENDRDVERDEEANGLLSDAETEKLRETNGDIDRDEEKDRERRVCDML